MAKVTVLTAVYNAERYLRQCLDSLRNQTLVDCQFVCIDDCSTDASSVVL
ncbi:MAG: glycosyltransferase, partial [Bacteroidaceae bacterium]|nr:glycosyltransferase [Bacteroidaceae bacterium]